MVVAIQTPTMLLFLLRVMLQTIQTYFLLYRVPALLVHTRMVISLFKLLPVQVLWAEPQVALPVSVYRVHQILLLRVILPVRVRDTSGIHQRY